VVDCQGPLHGDPRFTAVLERVSFVIEGTLQDERLQMTLTVDGIDRGSQVLTRLEKPQ
jgi:hypothetical protein